MTDTSHGPRIRDIPLIAGLLESVESLAALRRAFPLLRPFLRPFGVDTASMGESFREIDELKSQAELLATVPDRFNDLFAPLGWIIHGDMNLEVAREAISLAESGRMGEAEDLLVGYYSPEESRWMLQRMLGVNAFLPRMRLAELALEDYEAGRYHACIPVVLALIDGLVSELHEKRRGFFAEERDLTAWDSIAAHESGLNALADLFRKGRRKLNTEEITVPYRHGILHGWEMAYDTRLVAAKTWAALFAVREWAQKAERREREPPTPEPQPTLRELAERLKENAATKERIEAWEPRSLVVGGNLPVSGEPADYPPDSPERVLVEFLHLWKARNYGQMARYLRLPFGGEQEVSPSRVREVYEPWPLACFAIRSIVDEAPAITEVELELDVGLAEPRIHKFRLLYWHPDGDVAVRGDPDGLWGIVTWYI